MEDKDLKYLGTLYGRDIYVDSPGEDRVYDVLTRVFKEMLDTTNRIKNLPWYKRLFNQF